VRHLVVALDDAYVLPFRVLWRSLVETKSVPLSTTLYVLHSSTLSLESRLTLREVVEPSGILLKFRPVSLSSLGDLPLAQSDHVSEATYYRLLVHDLLPKKVSSVVYLDVDLVAVSSVRELFSIELDQPVAAVDHSSPSMSFRLWGPLLGGYFQAGVLIIDLVRWRAENVSATFAQILKNDRERIRWWDQDVLNIAFQNNWQRLPYWFNVTKFVREFVTPEEMRQTSRLIHFTGSRKPWNSQQSRIPDSDQWQKFYELEFGKPLALTQPRSSKIRSLIHFFRTIFGRFISRGH
jgi:lipopolysaccharide biosynthesis glycosyltransferase